MSTSSPASFDLFIYGATPGGIAMAVRAAREGLRVLLATREQHLGGMLTSGLGVEDTLYTGNRAPLYTEFREGVIARYRETYGPDSPQLRTCLAGGRITFEPRVAEQVITRMVEREPNVTVLRGHEPVAVERVGRLVTAVLLRPAHDPSGRAGNHSGTQRITARIFADATYEADLAALAGVPYRVGRESRHEFNEQHAGRIFTTHVPGPFPREARDGILKLLTFRLATGEISAGSTGEGDRCVQAFNYRASLCSDPDNRILPERPATYDRADYLGLVLDQAETVGIPYHLKSQNILDDIQKFRMGNGNIPNQKSSWNLPTFPGLGHGWPEGDWTTREEIAQRHWDLTVGLLWFLQNDEAVPEHVREDARRWGLSKDEFTDNDHRPYELYVREVRRIVGRYTFTEHDGTLALHSERAPLHEDAIAITEWPMDSHECTPERRYGTLADGKFLLSEATRPGQVPYRCLLPQDLDNLLVPVCMSCTHVGWGTLRLEPVWMHVGESAGHAAALALELGTLPGTLPVPRLQRRLVERGVMLSFFNEFDMSSPEPWVPAVQLMGARGYFSSYDARASDPLDEPTATKWTRRSGIPLDPGQPRSAAAQRIYASAALD